MKTNDLHSADPNRFPQACEWLSAFDSELARTGSESTAAAFASADPSELLSPNGSQARRVEAVWFFLGLGGLYAAFVAIVAIVAYGSVIL